MDAAIGWSLIVVVALACYCGTTFLTRFLVRSIGASLEEGRRERERIQEELDELSRQELLAIVENERR